MLVAVLLRCGPAALEDQCRAAAQDGIGRILAIVPVSSSQKESHTHSDVPAREVEELVSINRALAVEVAQLRSEIAKLRESGSARSGAAAPLSKIQLISTRVIGAQATASGGNGSVRWLTALGRQQGLTGEELVVSGSGWVMEHGVDLGLRPDQLVCAEQALFGRAIKVGRWTTLIQPLTDPQFRIAARIVRQTSVGPVQGPAGILAGTGAECRLDEVSATEAVAVGDYVLTDPLASLTGGSIYCGRVTAVALDPSAEHWRVTVTPLHRGGTSPPELDVIRGELSPVVTNR